MDLNKVSVLNYWVSKSYISIDTFEFQNAELERLISVAKSVGFKADFDKLKITEENKFAARLISDALLDSKYVDYNMEQGLDENLRKDPRSFFTIYCKNPKSPFYLDMTQYLPEFEDTLDIIHKCGGKAFLPHTAGYIPKVGDDAQKKLAWDECKRFTESIFKEYSDKLDGIELIHPCYEDNEEFKEFLVKFSKDNNLHVTGGTDYHVQGESLCNDINGNPITDKRLPYINKWVKKFSLNKIKEIAHKTLEEKHGGER